MNYEHDKVYINDVAFPYTPINDIELNDVDLDPYTNTNGYTMRNRKRSDINSIAFSIDTLEGTAMKDLILMTKPEWFNCTYWDDEAWAMVTRKMYRSPMKYTRYYIDPVDENKNIYINITFSFVEQ